LVVFPGPAIPSHLNRNTLSNSGKNGKSNQWTNCQIRLTAGSGAGQISTVASNTAKTLTVSNAWSTAPDASSQYSIEGNDDVLNSSATTPSCCIATASAPTAGLTFRPSTPALLPRVQASPAIGFTW